MKKLGKLYRANGLATGQFHVASFDSETVTAAVSSAKGFYPAVDLHA